MLYNNATICNSGDRGTENLKKSRSLNNIKIYKMKKKLKITMFSLALLLIITSALTAGSVYKKPVKVSASIFTGERYWYESNDVTYTSRFKNVQDEISYLSSAQPLYDFYSSQVTGSEPYEYGYSVMSPSGSPAETIFRKLK